MNKEYFNFSKNSLEKSEHFFKKTFDKGLLIEKENFIAMNAHEWDRFLKFILELDKDLKKSDSIRHIILTSAIAVERFIDVLFIKIYNLDRYKKLDAYDFLSNISLVKKIEIIKDLKKKYKNKKPKLKIRSYKNYVSFSLEFLQTLRSKKFGKKMLQAIGKIEEEINRKNGFLKPGFPSVLIMPKSENIDYLPDDIIDVLKKIDIKKLDEIRILRNKVAHEWNYEEVIAKRLKVKKRQLNKSVRVFCLEVLNHFPSLSLR